MCCHLFFLPVVVDVTEFARESALGELLCADDLVLMSEKKSMNSGVSP